MTKQRLLAGRTLLLPFAQQMDSEWITLLREQGAKVLAVVLQPVRKTDKDAVDDIYRGLATYEWAVFSSAAVVEAFFATFFQHYQDLRCLGPMRIGCLTAEAAKAVEALHLQVDALSTAGGEEAFAEQLLALETFENLKVLVVAETAAPLPFSVRLEAQGQAIVDNFSVCDQGERCLGQSEAVQAFRQYGADAVCFVDADSVAAFMAQAGALRLAVTARQPRACGLSLAAVEAMRVRQIPVDFAVAVDSSESVVNRLAAYLQ